MQLMTQAAEPLPDPVIPRRRKYPLDTMAIGDMFFVPDRESNNLVQYVSGQGAKLGRKFRTRFCTMRETIEGWKGCPTDDPRAVRGIGVWRQE
jgi:hypothetical protein